MPGREHRTEPRQMAMQCCCACVQGAGNQAEKSKEKKKRETNADNTPQRHKEAGQKGTSG